MTTLFHRRHTSILRAAAEQGVDGSGRPQADRLTVLVIAPRHLGRVAPEEEYPGLCLPKDVHDRTHGQRAWAAPAAGIQCCLRTNVHSLSPNAPSPPSSSRHLVRTRLGQTRASRRMTSLFTSTSPVGTKPSRS